MPNKIKLEFHIDRSPYNLNLIDYIVDYEYLDRHTSYRYSSQEPSVPLDIVNLLRSMSLGGVEFTEISVTKISYSISCSYRIGISFSGMLNAKIILVESTESLGSITSIVFSSLDNQEITLRNLEVDELIFPVDLKIKNLNLFFVKLIQGDFFSLDLIEFNSRRVNFGGVVFSKVNFHKAIFHECNLSQTSFNNITWPNGLEIVEISKDNFLSKKETFRQIKFVYDSIGNKTEANRFFAKEMEYHMKALHESGNKKDYYIALLQKVVSDFGNDWVRAFVIYLIFCGASYMIYHTFYDFTDYTLTNAFNPIPKTEDIKNFVLLIFALIKILIVYQIVVALRRISQR